LQCDPPGHQLRGHAAQCIRYHVGVERSEHLLPNAFSDIGGSASDKGGVDLMQEVIQGVAMSEDNLEQFAVSLSEAEEGVIRGADFFDQIFDLRPGLVDLFLEQTGGLLYQLKKQCVLGRVVQVEGADPNVSISRDVRNLRV